MIKVLKNILIICSLTSFITLKAEIPSFGLIAHACGITPEGDLYTNSKEALLRSLEMGYKFIEVDLAITSDSQVVALHDWYLYNTLFTDNEALDETPHTLNDFLNSKYYGEYTTMSLTDVLEIVKDKDVIIVTDKVSDPVIIDKYFSEFKDRLLIEAFSLDDYNELKRLGYTPMFSQWLHSADWIAETLENMVDGHAAIDFITIDIKDDYSDPYVPLDLSCLAKMKVAAYYTNSEEFIKEHLGKDIDYIYTDKILP